MSTKFKTSAIPLLVLLTIFSLVACQKSQENTNNRSSDSLDNRVESETLSVLFQDDDLQIVSPAFVRVAPINGMTAGFFTIIWKNEIADSLIDFKTEVALKHEIHETFEKEQGMMGMRRIKGLALSSSEKTVLKPGGAHLMIMQLQKDLKEGDYVELNLSFINKAPIDVKIPVKSLLAN